MSFVKIKHVFFVLPHPMATQQTATVIKPIHSINTSVVCSPKKQPIIFLTLQLELLTWNWQTWPSVRTQFTIEKKLNGLKIGKSAGSDQIHPKLLQETAAVLKTPLQKLFTKCISIGKIPDSWRLGHITPIFTKGKKSDPANYRPVSLTSVICKVMSLWCGEQYWYTLRGIDYSLNTSMDSWQEDHALHSC